MTHWKAAKGRLCDRCHETPLPAHRVRYPSFCNDCGPKRMEDCGGTAAHKLVDLAIRRGDLPRACTLTCTDCSKPASDYDHRDYGKPLEVQPVCRSCNRKRGPARPVLTFELP